MGSVAEQLLELHFQEDTPQMAAISSKEHNLGLNRSDSMCSAIPPPTVTTELLSPQAVGPGGNSGLSGPGLGTGHSPDPTECPVRDKRNLKLSVQGEHPSADISAGQFGCKHPAQR